eukprot:5236-Heterococcus_DN1.PRE.2
MIDCLLAVTTTATAATAAAAAPPAAVALPQQASSKSVHLVLIQPELRHYVHALQLLKQQLACIGYTDSAHTVRPSAVLTPAIIAK